MGRAAVGKVALKGAEPTVRSAWVMVAAAEAVALGSGNAVEEEVVAVDVAEAHGDQAHTCMTALFVQSLMKVRSGMSMMSQDHLDPT